MGMPKVGRDEGEPQTGASPLEGGAKHSAEGGISVK